MVKCIPFPAPKGGNPQIGHGWAAGATLPVLYLPWRWILQRQLEVAQASKECHPTILGDSWINWSLHGKNIIPLKYRLIIVFSWCFTMLHDVAWIHVSGEHISKRKSMTFHDRKHWPGGWFLATKHPWSTPWNSTCNPWYVHQCPRLVFAAQCEISNCNYSLSLSLSGNAVKE